MWDMYLQEPIYKRLRILVKTLPQTRGAPFGEKNHSNSHCADEHLFCHNVGVLFSHYQLVQGKPPLCGENEGQAWKFHAPNHHWSQQFQAHTPLDLIPEEDYGSCILHTLPFLWNDLPNQKAQSVSEIKAKATRNMNSWKVHSTPHSMSTTTSSNQTVINRLLYF